MKIFLTGATGHLGNELLKHFEQSHEVYFLSRRPEKTSKKNLQQNTEHIFHYKGKLQGLKQFLKSKEIDYIVHCAADTRTSFQEHEFEEYLQSNFILPMQLLEASKDCPQIQKIILAGSYWQQQTTISGKKPLYTTLKESISKIAKTYANKDLKIIELLLGDIYGPNDTRNKLISFLIQTKINNLKIELSPGEQRILPVYISDVIGAFQESLDLDQEKCFEQFSIHEKSHTIKEIVSAINSVHTKSPSLKCSWGEKDYSEYQVMNPKALGRKPANWNPKVTLKEGIQELIKRSNL